MDVHVYAVSVCLPFYLARSLTRLFSFSFFGPAGIQLHHSSENGSSDYRKGKHGPWGFVYERSAVHSPYITNQDALPPAHYSLWMLSHLGVGWGKAGVQISSFNSTHRSAAVCVVDMLGVVFAPPPHQAVRCYVIEACQSTLGIPLKCFFGVKPM